MSDDVIIRWSAGFEKYVVTSVKHPHLFLYDESWERAVSGVRALIAYEGSNV